MKLTKYLDKSPLLMMELGYEKVVRDVGLQLMQQELNLVQALILVGIFFELKRTVTPKKLSLALYLSKSNLAQNLNALIKAELIERFLSPLDARSYQLQLTSEGQKKAKEIVRIFERLQRRFEQGLGKEELERTIQNLEGLVRIYEESRSTIF